MFPENFRCVISGPSECGKILILKHLLLNSIQFDRPYIIGPTGNQYDDSKYKDIMFIKDIKKIVPPEELSEDIKNVCRGRHKNCNIIYLNQNLFHQIGKVFEKNLIGLFYLNREVMFLISYIMTSLTKLKLTIKILIV